MGDCVKEDNGLNAYSSHRVVKLFFRFKTKPTFSKSPKFSRFFFAVLNRSAGIPKAKSHDVDNNREIQFYPMRYSFFEGNLDKNARNLHI